MLATPERTETQPERLAPYRILGVLGRGGMGVVYRARHERNGELAAIKSQSAAEPLRHAEAVARQIGAGPESELEQAIVKLRAAQAAFVNGEHHRLFRGDLLERMADGVRQWAMRTHLPA